MYIPPRVAYSAEEHGFPPKKKADLQAGVVEKLVLQFMDVRQFYTNPGSHLHTSEFPHRHHTADFSV